MCVCVCVCEGEREEDIGLDRVCVNVCVGESVLVCVKKKGGRYCLRVCA